MFHQTNHLFFGRKNNGDVRILKLPYPNAGIDTFPTVDGDYPQAEFDVTIPKDRWVSAIASVGKPEIEIGEKYDLAKQIHGANF